MAVPEILRWLSSLQQQLRTFRYLELELKRAWNGSKAHMKPKNTSMSIKHLNHQFAAGMDPKACV
jgi:hypothetical protein